MSTRTPEGDVSEHFFCPACAACGDSDLAVLLAHAGECRPAAVKVEA